MGLRGNRTGAHHGGRPSTLGLPFASLHHPRAPGGLLGGQYAQPTLASPAGPRESLAATLGFNCAEGLAAKPRVK